MSPSLSLIALLSAGAAVLAMPAALQAQDDDIPEISQPVVQPIKGAASMRLNEALARLGKDPRDVPALMDAGKAALGAGDVDAAVGFYQRADQLAPGNAGVKAGLASALVRKEDPLSAISLFEAAERLGTFDPALLGERGLAYDLVGDNSTAQRYYRQVQTVAPNDENARRLALSLAISGDKRGMETALAPLLQKQDKAAWRIRAFGHAILGQTAEAEAIANSTMPATLARAVTPYLRFMPRLTKAQQAAAASFGHFPRAADIGLDDPRITAYAAANPTRIASAASPGTALAPTGQPLGRANSRNRPKRDEVAANTPPPALVVAQMTPPPRPVELVPEPTPAARQIVTPRPGTLSGSLTSGGLTTAPADVPLEPARTVAPEPKPVPVIQTPAPTPPPRRDLADVFADLSTPSREVVPSDGAVDIRRIAPSVPAAAKPKAAEPVCVPTPAKGKRPAVKCPVPVDCDPKKAGKTGSKAAKGTAKATDPKCEVEAKPAKVTQPSRIWVQVATGRNKAALAFDWKRMAREDEAVFRSRKPFTAGWGQTNRLLTGPFDSERAADAYIAQLKKAGVPGAFTWTSPAGQVVDPLALTK